MKKLPLFVFIAATAIARASMGVNGTSHYATVQETNLQFGTGDFTISGWFYPSVVNYGVSAQGTIVSKDYTGVEVFIYQTKLNAYVGGTSNAASGTTTLSTGVWYHFVLRRSGTSLTLYLNGNSEASATNSASASNAGTAVHFGKRPANSSSYFNGRLGEYGFWNAALDTAEITALSNGLSPLMVHRVNLVGYFPLTRPPQGEHDVTSTAAVTLFGSPPEAVHPRRFR